jgi:hypothetical protein
VTSNGVLLSAGASIKVIHFDIIKNFAIAETIVPNAVDLSADSAQLIAQKSEVDRLQSLSRFRIRKASLH